MRDECVKCNDTIISDNGYSGLCRNCDDELEEAIKTRNYKKIKSYGRIAGIELLYALEGGGTNSSYARDVILGIFETLTTHQQSDKGG
jgi:hypothetical protein